LLGVVKRKEAYLKTLEDIETPTDREKKSNTGKTWELPTTKRGGKEKKEKRRKGKRNIQKPN